MNETADDTTDAMEESARSTRHQVSQALRGNYVALAGTLIIATIVLTALLVTIDQHFLDKALVKTVMSDPQAISASERLEPPSRAHLMGTDKLGRDIASRIVFGTAVTMRVSLMAILISVSMGVVAGTVAGFYGGWVDDVIMRVVDILLAFPGIILALAVAGILGPSLNNVIIALAVQGWVTYARLIRVEVLSVRETEYVKAAKSIGANDYQVMKGDVLPNAIQPIIVQATLDLGRLILAVAALSFLGLGPQPPTPSWGIMLSLGRDTVQTAWWLSVFPGLAIFVTVMGFNLLGDVLRDVLDPHDQTQAQGGL